MADLDPDLWPVVRLTLAVSGLAVGLATLLGVPAGVWLGTARFRGKGVVAALVHTGMALPPVVVGLLVYLLLSRSGPLAPLGWLFTPQAMVLAQTALALPFVVGITAAAVAAVPADLAFQLRAVGATPRQARRAVLWEARPGVALAVATAFGRSVSEVGAVLMVGGNITGQTRVLTTAIILETGKGNFPLALALGAVLLAFALAVNVAILWLHGRTRP